jgi:cytoskeletal protein CcmA (bactofilin family)
MALWKETNTPASAASNTPLAPLVPERPAVETSAVTPSRKGNVARVEGGESVIAAGLMIEGKIEGSGSVRIAGRFKGDVRIDGNFTIEAGAHLTGQVIASVVHVAGELQGNIESAKRVDVMEGGVIVGDVKAGSITVAAGSRMRGNVQFGWDDEKVAKLDLGRISDGR